MKNVQLSGKALVKGFQTFVISFTTTENGRIVSSKAIDEVMEDIFGKKKVLERICRSENVQDLKSIFFGLDFTKICEFLASEDSIAIINELILLDLEIRNLTSRYTKLSKKGGNKKKRDRIKQNLSNRKKKYKKVVKNLREELNIFDEEKEVKFKDKYKSLDKYLEKRDDPYYYVFEDMDDYDDEDFDDDAKFLLGGRPRAYRDIPNFEGINPYFAQFMHRKPVSASEELDDVDLDDMDDDEDDDIEDLHEKFDMLQEQNSNMLSLLTALVSQINGGLMTPSDDTVSEGNDLHQKYANLTKCVQDMQKNQQKLMDENAQLTEMLQQFTIADDVDPESCDDVSDLMDALLSNESEDAVDNPVSEEDTNVSPVTGVGLAEDDSEDDRPVKKDVTNPALVPEDVTNLDTPQLIDKVNDEKGGKTTSGKNNSKNKSSSNTDPNVIQ